MAVEGAPRSSPVGEERPHKQARVHKSVDDMDEDELFSSENVERSAIPAPAPARLSLEPVQEDPYFNPDMEVSTPPMGAAPPPEAVPEDVDIGLLANIAIE